MWELRVPALADHTLGGDIHSAAVIGAFFPNTCRSYIDVCVFALRFEVCGIWEGRQFGDVSSKRKRKKMA